MLSWLGFSTPSVIRKWVLQDISFALQPGEAVGLIGLNGAGKSTLLKVITGTLKPTTGRVHINGRVAAILELGMGFHLNLPADRMFITSPASWVTPSSGSMASLMKCMLFPKSAITSNFQCGFTSSGMQARLAFAVATAERPEILIVDEALSVGDAYFQHKSFDRIRQFTRQGTTLLLVSHDKQAIQSICNRAILLDGGTVAMEGEPDVVMDYYNALLAAHQDQQIVADPHSQGGLFSGTGEAEFISHQICDDDGKPVEIVDVGQSLHLHISARAYMDIPDLVLGFLIKDRYGQDVFGTNTRLLDKVCYDIAAGTDLSWSFAFPANIGPGTYSITLALHSHAGHIEHNYAWQERALMFEVVNRSQFEFVGVAWLDVQLESRQHHE